MRRRPLPPSPSFPVRRQQIGQVLHLLGRGVLAFHPRLVQLTGSVTSALLLSQSLYWTRVMADRGERLDGWFWKTREDWKRETALSRHEQDTARHRLGEHSFWQERRIGMPAKMWYRVDLADLARTLDRDFDGQWDWRDEQVSAQLLGRPILVYRAFADLCRSVPVAVLLSRLLAEERIALRALAMANRDESPQADAWRRYDIGAMLAATGLTRAEFYHARQVLREFGYLSERRTGVPPRSEWRLELGRLAHDLQRCQRADAGSSSLDIDPVRTMSNECKNPENNPETRAVVQSASKPHTDYPESGQLAFLPPIQSLLDIDPVQPMSNESQERQNSPETRAVVQSAGKPHTDYPESGQLDFLNPANQSAGIRTHGRPESGFPIEGLTTGKPITSEHPQPPAPLDVPAPLPTGAAAVEDSGGGGQKDSDFTAESLIWPTVLIPEERPIAMVLLMPVLAQAQEILDELSGQASRGQVRSHLGYLRKLAEQAKAGIFLPMVAARVAAARDRAEAVRCQRERPPAGLDYATDIARISASVDRANELRRWRSGDKSPPPLPPAVSELSAEKRSARRHALDSMRAILRGKATDAGAPRNSRET